MRCAMKMKELGSSSLGVMLTRTAEKSVAIAVQSLLRNAHELGYGTCVMDAPLVIEDEMHQMLDTPHEQQSAMMVPLGVAAQVSGPPKRRPV